MFEKLGIVTNIWSKRMGNGDRFEDLVVQFGENGFKDMEVRDGDYFRNSAFGEMVQEIETAMESYSDGEWKQICEKVWQDENECEFIKPEHQSLVARVGEFAKKAAALTLSYAIAHAWLSRPADLEADNKRIITAKKNSYLLCPHKARLRLVDLGSESEIDPHIAVGNVKRYRSLLPNYPIVFAVENARQPADFTLNLAMGGGALLTYDEANVYQADGSTLNEPETFWEAVTLENITTVHFKQKTEDGVLSQVGDGFVDFGAIAHRLKVGGYKGDLLLENIATDQPLADAIKSREYLLKVEGQLS